MTLRIWISTRSDYKKVGMTNGKNALAIYITSDYNYVAD